MAHERGAHATIKAVLFDFDGTLMDTDDLIYHSWQYAFRQLTGKEGEREAIHRTYGEPLYDSVAAMFPHHDTQHAVDVYRRYQYENFEEEIRLYPGVLETLRQLRTRGIKVALVTSRLRNTTLRGMKKYDMEPLFDVMITVEDCRKSKPDPEPIEKALTQLVVTEDQAIMVGDTKYDQQCAKNAGIPYVQVGWARAIGVTEPEYIIHESMMELLEIIASK